MFAKAVFVQCIVLLESDATEARLSDEECQAREKNPMRSLMLLLFDEEHGAEEKSREKAKRHLSFKEKNKETAFCREGGGRIIFRGAAEANLSWHLSLLAPGAGCSHVEDPWSKGVAGG
ncbi:hypothetical protein CYMTET_45154 [Cymbomonas tetramitiformis]|uniref:Secreted protein n=1 Tax=Cymbomonas tetramitiformis TaxID=36881 RepID=A0AAE0C033_9CHLO|nr:hypothetical protein CYMTET_45154 [Cymbomonas tetramitiformis]